MGRSRQPPPPRELPPLPLQTRAAVERAFGRSVLPPSANAGLVWDRYTRVWTPDGEPVKSEHRSGYLKELVAAYKAQAAHRADELAARIRRLDDHVPGGRDFRTTGRLVTGLGAEHPVENGFTFEHALGVPVLPGSSLKGVCRAGARLLGAPAHEIEALLGSDPPVRATATLELDPSLHAGSVVFLDALPTHWPQLEVDLLNPHHPLYYADQGLVIADRTRVAVLTEEPRPVSFLVVAPGTRFRIWLRGRGGLALNSRDTERVWGWLSVGLEALGIGGKTAAGYGALTPVNQT